MHHTSAMTSPAVGDLPSRLALAQAQASPDGVLVVSPTGRVLAMNARFAETWGLGASVVESSDGDALLAAILERVADPEVFLARAHELSDRPEARVRDEIQLRDGRVLERWGAPLHDTDGTCLGWAWYVRDVTVHKRTEAELRELTRTLQRSLLPPRRPDIPGMDVAARHRPADRDLALSGDFFDVFRLRTNEWGLAIGDVCGKGAPAAALTALTRYSLRSAAVHNDHPADVLREVNAVVLSEPDLGERFCSVAFCRLELDVCGAWVTMACGGHPRPYVVRRAGWIDLRGQPGTVLGLFPDPDVADDRVGLGPGDALVLCTDGITEARTESGEMFDEERLPAVLLECTELDAQGVADRLVQEALAHAGGRIDDDVAVLVVRVPEEARDDPVGRLRRATGAQEDALPLTPYVPGEDELEARSARAAPPREARIRLPADPRSPGDARRFVAGVLHSWRMSELVGGDVELLVSEVTSNALRHAGSPFTVILRYDGARVRVEVGDGSRALPQPRRPGPEEIGGRGLVLVEALAADWGVRPTLEGKRVWFELPAG
jgi:PAS domain S-box-containing protein